MVQNEIFCLSEDEFVKNYFERQKREALLVHFQKMIDLQQA